MDGAAANLKTLNLEGYKGLGDKGVAAIVNGLAAGGVVLEKLTLKQRTAGPKTAAAALGRWLRVVGAAANLKAVAGRQ